MRKSSDLTITDQFCGAGGSSQGVRKVSERIKGVHLKLALNHWKLAIETHSTNFPETLHDCTDISAVDPRRYPRTNILITSPECTNHSLAKGQKQVKAQMDLFDKKKLDASAERSRATMWDVPRFAEYHNYECIIVENVVDARRWVMWDAWLLAMHALGYNHHCCFFNSMHFHPTPQSRDRMYVVFWKKGNKSPNLNFTPQAFCEECGCDVEAIQSWKKTKLGKYKTQYIYRCPAHLKEVTPYYYAAFNAIDWSDIGKKIGDREKPLSENTMRRIQYGLDKYCTDPFVFHAAYGKTARGTERSVTDPLFTQTTLMSQALIVNDQHSTGINFRVKSAGDVFPTVATQNNYKLIMPFVIKGEHTLQEGYVKQTTEAFQTQTVRQSMGLITPPMVIELNRTGKARHINKPLATVLTSGSHHGILTNDAWNSFMSYYYGNHQASHISEPIGTVTTKDRAFMVQMKPRIEDCYFRMLKPGEIKKAMAFEDDYVILGSGKDQVKQCGNAVTPPVMEWLVERCVESLN